MPANVAPLHICYKVCHWNFRKKTVKCPETSVCIKWRYSKRKSSVHFRVMGPIM